MAATASNSLSRMQLATVDENEPLHVVADEEEAAMLHHVRTIQDLLVKYSAATDSINAALDAMQEVCFDKVNADLIYTDTVASFKLKTLRKDLAAKREAAISAVSALDDANAACSKDAIYAKAVASIELYPHGSACRDCVRKCIDEACDNRKAAREAADEAKGAMAIAKATVQALAVETKCRVLTIDRRYRQDEERMRHTFDEALIARKRYFIEEFQETFAAFL
jgi:hypothetical protein